MTHDDAVAFLGQAGPFRGAWADIGAGSGTFSRALAQLLGPDGAVLAVDTDERALADLRRRGASDADAPIRTLRADMHDLAALDARPTAIDPSDPEHPAPDPATHPAPDPAVQPTPPYDGVLFANVLHFTRRAVDVLASAAQLLKPDGRVVVIEYERRMPNPWVPHPLSLEKLADVARRAGLGAPRDVARRASAYHREMYCAVLAGPRDGGRRLPDG